MNAEDLGRQLKYQLEELFFPAVGMLRFSILLLVVQGVASKAA